MGISKVTRNYQISIPKDVRTSLGVKIGDIVMIRREDNVIIVKPLEKDIVEKTFGSWKKMKKTGVEYVREIRDEAEKREAELGL